MENFYSFLEGPALVDLIFATIVSSQKYAKQFRHIFNMKKLGRHWAVISAKSLSDYDQTLRNNKETGVITINDNLALNIS